MKTKTILELLTLSSSLYFIARDTQILDRMIEYTDKGKESINDFMSDDQLDKNGNKLEFVERIVAKTHELKEELNKKIEQEVVKFYKKINVTHLDEVKALHEKIDKLDATVALLEARINHLEY